MMDEITRGLTTPEQATREAKFLRNLSRLRADGHFTTTDQIGVGEAITIEHKGNERCAEVAWTKVLDGGLAQVFFRWTDETPNA